MANTGKKIYSDLREIFSDTGLPTGNEKPNAKTDPDYIAPIEDLVACPKSQPSEQLIEKIVLVLKNSSSQSIELTNLVLERAGSNGTDPYWKTSSIGILPNENIQRETIQLTKLVDVLFKFNKGSKSINIKTVASYKQHQQSSFNEIKTENANIGGTIQMKSLITNKTGIQSAVNTLMIEIFDNAEPTLPKPIVDAGLDQTVSDIKQTQLQGTITHSEVISLKEWSCISAPFGNISSVSFTNKYDLSTAVNVVDFGQYVFKLTATDVKGVSNSDSVNIEFKKVEVFGLFVSCETIITSQSWSGSTEEQTLGQIKIKFFKDQALTQPVDITGQGININYQLITREDDLPDNISNLTVVGTGIEMILYEGEIVNWTYDIPTGQDHFKEVVVELQPGVGYTIIS